MELVLWMPVRANQRQCCDLHSLGIRRLGTCTLTGCSANLAGQVNRRIPKLLVRPLPNFSPDHGGILA